MVFDVEINKSYRLHIVRKSYGSCLRVSLTYAYPLYNTSQAPAYSHDTKACTKNLMYTRVITGGRCIRFKKLIPICTRKISLYSCLWLRWQKKSLNAL